MEEIDHRFYAGSEIMVFEDRAAFLQILETYVLAFNILPERAESLHTPQDVVQDIPLPMSYPFSPL